MSIWTSRSSIALIIGPHHSKKRRSLRNVEWMMTACGRVQDLPESLSVLVATHDQVMGWK